MPNVVASCENIDDEERYSSSCLNIPYSRDQRQEAKKRHKKGIRFVNLKRDKWTPYSVVCSAYLKPDDNSSHFLHVESEDERTVDSRWLRKDEIGVDWSIYYHEL